MAGPIITALITKSTNKKIRNFDELRTEFKTEMRNHVIEQDKTFLTDFLSEIEAGIPKSEIQIKRAHEVFEEYSKNGGNSYIHDKWEQLKNKKVL